MIRYTLIRTVWIFIILFTIVSLNFVLLRLAPVYPPQEIEAKNMWYERQVRDGLFERELVTDPDEVAKIRAGLRDRTLERVRNDYYIDEGEQFRIYKPVPIGHQYLAFVENVFTEWNWGTSQRFAVNVPVFEVLQRRIPITVQLNLIALFFYIPIGFSLGIVAALKKNSLADNIISIAVMIFISLPSFVVMTFLVLIAFQVDWLYPQFVTGDIGGTARMMSFILPVLGLAFGPIAHLTRTTRAELTEVLTSEFLLLARTKGLTRPQAVVRHAMRNSMVPLVPGIIASFVGLLSGSVIIEEIYGIAGTGRLFVQSMRLEDYSMVVGTAAFYTIIGLFAVLLVDLSYGVVDPRIRMGARK